MTSVKEVRIETPPTDTALGLGSFVFSDDYSVFDWGKMPESIPEKGASLCSMGADNFERLEDVGLPTHYRGVFETDEITTLAMSSAAPREMAIDLTQVPELPFRNGSYDYDAYHTAGGENFLVPLEIVFRNTVPVGSSLRRRTAPMDHGLDYRAWPEEAVELEEPIIEFSTKYEEQDRYLGREEADRLAGKARIEDLERLAKGVNETVTRRAGEVGLRHQDGKIECLYFEGEVRIADVVGTFDENRFSYDGQQLSKEVIRQYHKRQHPDWVEAVQEAKAEATRRGIAEWRSLCTVEPPALRTCVVRTVRDMYTAGANAYCGRRLFDAPSLEEAVEAVRTL